MFCSNCGAEIADGSKFCNSCGAKVGEVISSNPAGNADSTSPSGIFAGKEIKISVPKIKVELPKKKKSDMTDTKEANPDKEAKLDKKDKKDKKGEFYKPRHKLIKALEKHKVIENPEKTAHDLSVAINTYAIAGAGSHYALTLVPAGELGGYPFLGAVTLAMVLKINKICGISLSKNFVKVVSGGLVAAVGGFYISTHVMGFMAGLIPGVGTFVKAMTAPAQLAMNFAVFKTIGEFYLKIIIHVFEAGLNPNELTKAQIKEIIAREKEEIDMKQMMDEAKEEYLEGIKSGKITGKEKMEEDLSEIEEEMKDEMAEVEEELSKYDNGEQGE